MAFTKNRIDWKAAHRAEQKAHLETKELVQVANHTVAWMQSAMWGAQRTAQTERNRYEECERQRVATQAQVDELRPANARLQAERDLLLMLLREWTLK